MKTEKEKMLAGEPYEAWDEELLAERTHCRKTVKKFNETLPGTPNWQATLENMIPDCGDAYIEPPFRCDYGSNIKLGKKFFANFNCVILDVNTVEIGDNVMFAPNVQIYTAGHPVDPVQRNEEGIEFGLPIKIGNNAWLGGGVIVCPGVTIGENAVIGAGSVVVKDIPANVVAAGNPCKVIRTIDV
ncbi:sugar O-acetyltransferase [Vibrio breoganii]|uniref:sugar O-acetyltransferase n=1 Tax=Vibrio breoganii TaxID=553239 RepID=UPI000C818A9D|nr:sugar O-acetyltransferase [Vibrio breoganii]PMK33453.1 maltose acetyltransferase [Vibrio breoganii]PMM21468.1 maltose acetyltransferase [Vibrio breoganii]PMO58511.1 maltose acetyltransferase [Vibrio breoganii]